MADVGPARLLERPPGEQQHSFEPIARSRETHAANSIDELQAADSARQGSRRNSRRQRSCLLEKYPRIVPGMDR